MESRNPISDLVSMWMRYRQSGQDLQPADLCKERPELLADVEEAILAIQRLEDLNYSAHESSESPLALEHNKSNDKDASRSALPQIHGFEVADVIGSGGMGVVFKAKQTGLNRDVAIKMMRRVVRTESWEMRRFFAEAEAISAIQHPHVLQVYGFGECDSQPYIALELCTGGCLADQIKSG